MPRVRCCRRRSGNSRTCNAGGDRTLRHNALRDYIYNFAKRAGLNPEREKQGLLLPTDGSNTRRRPADVYLPRWIRGSPAALDFAVTAPQRQEILGTSSKQAMAAADEYVCFKREHLDTDRLCREAGVEFLPMVIESTGAWAGDSEAVLVQLAAAAAANSGRKTAEVMRELLQGASRRVRAANARAELRRRVGRHIPDVCGHISPQGVLSAL